jgi:hypothetical protein
LENFDKQRFFNYLLINNKNIPVPEFIDPVFVKTSPKRSFSMTENEQFGLVFAKTGSIISGTDPLNEVSTYKMQWVRGFERKKKLFTFC